jgi:hypothetical protein
MPRGIDWIRAVSLPFLALLVSGCAEPPSPLTFVLPQISELENCATVNFRVTTVRGTEVSIGGVSAFANSDGIAALDVPRANFIESSSPRTLSLGFEYRGEKWRLTRRRTPSDALIAFERSPSTDSIQAVGSCANQRLVAVKWDQDERDPKGMRVAKIRVWGATAVHTTTGEASLAVDDSDPLTKTVEFRPNLRAQLLDSTLTEPLTASVLVKNAKGDSLELRLTVDYWVSSSWQRVREQSGVVGDILRPFADAELEPVPGAPPLGSARHHRVLVFDHVRRGYGTNPLPRAVAIGGGRVRDVDAVAYISPTWESPGPTCSAPPGFPLRTFLLLTMHVEVDVWDAREGKLIEQQDFATTPSCADGMHGNVRRDPFSTVYAWLEHWSGTPLRRL